LNEVVLDWRRFGKLTEARNAFRDISRVYVQTDHDRNPVRVGKASEGLETRYRGGTGYALDAAMHNSGNLVFVAQVEQNLCDAVEAELIWRQRTTLVYNNQGKTSPPYPRIEILHKGDTPKFSA